MQFVVKDIPDEKTILLDNGLRMTFQLLSAWRSTVEKAKEKDGNSSKQVHDPTKYHDHTHSR